MILCSDVRNGHLLFGHMVVQFYKCDVHGKGIDRILAADTYIYMIFWHKYHTIQKSKFLHDT